MNSKIEQLKYGCNTDYIKAKETTVIKKGTPIKAIVKANTLWVSSNCCVSYVFVV